MEFVGYFLYDLVVGTSLFLGLFYFLFSGHIGFLRFSVFLDLSSKMGSPKPNNGERVPNDFYDNQIVVLYCKVDFEKLQHVCFATIMFTQRTPFLESICVLKSMIITA